MKKEVNYNMLPKDKNGGISWKNSIGYKVPFFYDEVEGEIEIVGYNNGKLTVKYLNKEPMSISYSSFLKCNIGKILGKITNEFKVEIGQVFKDDKRDIVVTGRDKIPNKKGKLYKWYKYTCNVCGWTEGWMVEGALIRQKIGCSCCYGRTTVLGINTIWDTHKWLVDDFGLDEEFAKTHTYGTRDKGMFTCKDCGQSRYKNIFSVIKTKSIGCTCGDGKSYPEKFISCMLNQCELEFITQYFEEWSNNRYYDFYIPKYNMIIETHGEQHYIQTHRNGGRTLEEEQRNDRLKEKLAKENGIKNYIVIDCRESDLEYIKNSILNSKLNELFDLSKINWNKCEEFALKNVVKEVCEYWNQKEDWETTVDLGNIFNKDRHTIRTYLKRGSKLGWCNYLAMEEERKRNIKGGIAHGKPIEVFKEGVYLKTFPSAKELENQSLETFGTFLNSKNVSAVLNGRRKHHKGFTFSFV